MANGAVLALERYTVSGRRPDRDIYPLNIPPKANWSWKNCFSPYLYRACNAIERMIGRIKDFRRIATRCDRLE
jgi:transposase